MRNEAINVIFSIIGITLGAIGISNDKYQWPIFIIATIGLSGYTFKYLGTQIDELVHSMKDLKKELRYQKDLIEIKKDIAMLKMNKRGYSLMDMWTIITILSAVALIYLVYMALTT